MKKITRHKFTKKTKVVGIRLSEDIYKSVEMISKQDKVPASLVMRTLIVDGLCVRSKKK